MIYLDSSVLLELYLEGPRWRDARAILDLAEPKISSYLLLLEAPISLRRLLARDREGLEAALRRFDTDVIDIGLTNSLSEVAVRVRSDSRFARCRSLDALHACTALLVKEWTGQAVRLETFDHRLADLAAELGLR